MPLGLLSSSFDVRDLEDYYVYGGSRRIMFRARIVKHGKTVRQISASAVTYLAFNLRLPPFR
jgi:hypothetical protein